MTMLLVIVWLVLIVVVIALLALRIKRTNRSRFELNRLNDEVVLRRERLLGCLFAVRRVAILFVFAMVAIVAAMLFGGWSIPVVLVTLIISIMLARSRFIARRVNRIYEQYEPTLLQVVEKNAWLGMFMLAGDHVPRDQKLESTEQLLHLAETSLLFSDEQLSIVRHGIAWHQTTVRDIMTPREKIIAIKHSELLGPLVLDDLHKSGHSQFPVTKNGLNNAIGLLDITDSLEVSSSRASQKVEHVMSPRVVHVAETDTLPVALSLLQKSKQHMLLVTDSDGQTTGLVTIADITGSLLGKTGVK